MRWTTASVPRWLLIVIAWFAVPLWTIVLVARDTGSGVTGAIVKVLGSLAVLYLLYLVFRPRGTGILQLSHIQEQESQVPPVPEGSPDSGQATKWFLVTLTIALAIGSLLYRLSQDSYLHQTSAFFIGIPAVLAITLALTPRARSATGTIIKGLSLALMLSGVVFLEGFACILMAAPIFYAVGIAIGVPIDRARRKKRPESHVYSIVGIAILILSVEGVTPSTTLPQRETVAVTRTVTASMGEVRQALSVAPVFDGSLPTYLRFGFPRPVDASGSGLAVGDRRTIVFGDESPMEPMRASGHDHQAVASETGGELELKVVERGPGRVVFDLTRDETAFTHWVELKRSVVEWRPLEGGSTEVTWQLTFERKLSPAWYFAPWQRYAGKLATGYLIDTVATP